MISAWTRQHDKREAMRVLGDAGVPAGAIFDTMELTEEADFNGAASCRRCSTRPPARSRCRAGRCAWAGARRRSSRRRCLGKHQGSLSANGLVLTAKRSFNLARTRSSRREAGHGRTHRLGDPGKITEE